MLMKIFICDISTHYLYLLIIYNIQWFGIKTIYQLSSINNNYLYIIYHSVYSQISWMNYISSLILMNDIIIHINLIEITPSIYYHNFHKNNNEIFNDHCTDFTFINYNNNRNNFCMKYFCVRIKNK